MGYELPTFSDPDAVREWAQRWSESKQWTPETGHVLELIQALSSETWVMEHNYNLADHTMMNILLEAVDDLAQDSFNLDKMDKVSTAILNTQQEKSDKFGIAVFRFRKAHAEATVADTISKFTL